MPKVDATHIVGPLIQRLMKERHPDIHAAGVIVDADFAYAGKRGGAAVKLHGRSCDATIKANPVDMRRKGVADATITIDGKGWQLWTDRQREAKIAHELEHIVVQHAKDTGEVKEDDAGRPVIRMRCHDWEFGGFDRIARDYGEDSNEVQFTKHLANTRGQFLFPWAWGDDMALAPPTPAVELSASSS